MAITREAIWTIADALDDAGEKPTLAAVRRRLGGGSFTTISEAMTTWHAERAAKRKPAADPTPAPVTEAASQFAASVWQTALEMADGRLQAERLALTEAQQQLAIDKEEASAFADQLAQELEVTKVQVDELTSQLQQSRSRISELQSAHDSAQSRAERLQAVAEERQEMIGALRSELEKVRADRDQEIARMVQMMSSKGTKRPS